MNGKRFLLDTNAIISLLQGNNQILTEIHNAEWIGISIINRIEFLSFPNLNDRDIDCFNQFIMRIEVTGLDNKDTELIDLIINMRKQYRIKLPDAIIVSTAIKHKASLITADKQLKNISQLNVITF